MNLIRDIRLFESNIPNVDGNSIPSYIGKLYSYDDMDLNFQSFIICT